jgi:hypothetical protein
MRHQGLSRHRNPAQPRVSAATTTAASAAALAGERRAPAAGTQA